MKDSRFLLGQLYVIMIINIAVKVLFSFELWFEYLRIFTFMPDLHPPDNSYFWHLPYILPYVPSQLNDVLFVGDCSLHILFQYNIAQLVQAEAFLFLQAFSDFCRDVFFLVIVQFCSFIIFLWQIEGENGPLLNLIVSKLFWSGICLSISRSRYFVGYRFLWHISYIPSPQK